MIAWRLGKKTWSVSTINSILCNEKYKGDALLQKTFTVDFLTKTTKRNEGEIPQYYVTGNHEPINALIRSAANTDFNPDAFEADHARLEADYQHHLDTVESLEKQLHELEAKRAAITAFHQYRSENPAISYTPEAWRALVDHATIHPDGTITITFNDG